MRGVERTLEATILWWDRFWFADIPPHLYAVLRIALAALGLLGLIGLRDTSLFWDLSGIVPRQGLLGLKTLVANWNLASVFGRAVFWSGVLCYTAMAFGFRSGVSV